MSILRIFCVWFGIDLNKSYIFKTELDKVFCSLIIQDRDEFNVLRRGNNLQADKILKWQFSIAV